MATTEVFPITFPGWVTFTEGVPATVRASLDPRGIALEIPTGPRAIVTMIVRPETFAAYAPRQASHVEALEAALVRMAPADREKALALVLETCEDAAEAYGDGGLPETAEALSRFSAAWRGTSID